IRPAQPALLSTDAIQRINAADEQRAVCSGGGGPTHFARELFYAYYFELLARLHYARFSAFFAARNFSLPPPPPLPPTPRAPGRPRRRPDRPGARDALLRLRRLAGLRVVATNEAAVLLQNVDEAVVHQRRRGPRPRASRAPGHAVALPIALRGDVALRARFHRE